MFKQKSEQEVFGDKNNNSSKKPLFKKIIFSIIGAVLLAVIISLLPNLLGIFSEDIAPINDSDLRLQVVTVSNNENAYFDLMKLDDVIYFPKEKKQIISDMIAGKVWDGEFAEEQISKNMQAYDYFSDASLKQKYQDPSWAKPENVSLGTELPPISNWYQMSQLSALRALYFTKQGMDKKAIDEALKSVIIGQKILESQVPMIEYVTAIEMKRIGLETLQKIITSSDLDSENLKKYAQDFDRFYKNEEGLVTLLKGEYVLESSVADALVNKDIEVMNELLGEEKDDDYNLYKKINNSYYFKPNKTKQAFVENTRNNISKVDMVCSYIDKKEMQGNNPVVGSNPIGLYLKENLIGEILKYIFITDSNSVIIKKCNDDLLVANTQTLFAIKAYESDMGKSPVSLDDLVPEYLLSAPTNPYGGKELKYLAHNFNGGSVQNNDNKKIAEGCIVKQYEGPELISDISTDVRGGVVCHFYINTNLPVYNFTLHADVENNIINQIEITKGLEINVPVQVLDTEDMIEPPYRDADFFKAEDVNSDGYKDISLLIWWGVTGREGYMYWVFDPSKNIFVFDKERSDLY